MENNFEELVEKYLKGILSDNEKKEFVTLIERSSKNKENFIIQKAIKEAILEIERQKLRDKFTLNKFESAKLESKEDKMVQYMNAAYQNPELLKNFKNDKGLIDFDTIKKFLEGSDN